MTISELFNEIGDENICFQNLTEDVSSVTNDKQDSKITFYTASDKGHDLASAIITNHRPKFTAYIVWMPTDKWQEVMKQAAENET